MSSLRPILWITVMVFVVTRVAEAKTLSLTEAPFSATGDGTADDLPALARAVSEAKPGDTVLIPPGSYRMVLTGRALAIPDGVTLLGQGGMSKFALSSNGKSSDYREFLRPKSDVAIEGLTIERDADFPSVLLPIYGDASNIAFRNCRIFGNQARFPHSCHAFRVGVGIVKDFKLDGVVIENCCYGLFQSNDATGTLDGVQVEHCRFARNTASDLEFNSPRGIMRNIVVRECFFRDNLCKSASAGFAVGFVNVVTGRVEKCVIQNYGSEALHVEDRSADIQLVGNTIIGGSLRQPNGVIMVLSGSKRVTIEGNFIDARSNTNRPNLILVTSGGKQMAKPSEVLLTGNVLVNGSSTRSWFLQNRSGPAPPGNLVIPEAASAGKERGHGAVR